jgi:hypothetical protein
MCRMRRLARNVGWLLFPEPTQEWAKGQEWLAKYSPWLFLFIGVADMAFGFLYLAFLPTLPSFLDVLSDALSKWVVGIGFIGVAALFALPTNRRWARLGTRVACTLSFLALVPSILLRFLDFDPNGNQISVAAAVVMVMLWVVLAFSFIYLANRLGACRS